MVSAYHIGLTGARYVCSGSCEDGRIRLAQLASGASNWAEHGTRAPIFLPSGNRQRKSPDRKLQVVHFVCQQCLQGRDRASSPYI
jgi:hypothetical protein